MEAPVGVIVVKVALAVTPSGLLPWAGMFIKTMLTETASLFKFVGKPMPWVNLNLPGAVSKNSGLEGKLF